MTEKSKRRDSSEIGCAHRNVSYNCHRDFFLLLSGNAKLAFNGFFNLFLVDDDTCSTLV